MSKTFKVRSKLARAVRESAEFHQRVVTKRKNDPRVLRRKFRVEKRLLWA